MNKALSLSLILLLSTAAFASPPSPPSTGSGAPTPLAQSSAELYRELSRAWDNGRPTSASVLEGKWQMKTSETSAACGNLNSPNRSSSNPAVTPPTLEFGFDKVGGNSFTGDSPRGVFVVRSYNNYAIAGLNQGPFQVDSQEPQFSVWAYGSSVDNPSQPIQSRNAYYEETCRLLNGENNKLICRLRLVTLNDHFNNIDEVLACAADSSAAFSGYEKMK
jgi:hypothetical protein